MNDDRFAELFDRRRPATGNPIGQESLRGFTTNPLFNLITPTQVLMYQAAYQQAQKDAQIPEWPDAECWN